MEGVMSVSKSGGHSGMPMPLHISRPACNCWGIRTRSPFRVNYSARCGGSSEGCRVRSCWSPEAPGKWSILEVVAIS